MSRITSASTARPNTAPAAIQPHGGGFSIAMASASFSSPFGTEAASLAEKPGIFRSTVSGVSPEAQAIRSRARFLPAASARRSKTTFQPCRVNFQAPRSILTAPARTAPSPGLHLRRLNRTTQRQVETKRAEHRLADFRFPAVAESAAVSGMRMLSPARRLSSQPQK